MSTFFVCSVTAWLFFEIAFENKKVPRATSLISETMLSDGSTLNFLLLIASFNYVINSMIKVHQKNNIIHIKIIQVNSLHAPSNKLFSWVFKLYKNNSLHIKNEKLMVLFIKEFFLNVSRVLIKLVKWFWRIQKFKKFTDK